MLRYAWAYQSGGEYKTYPIQTITMRLERQILSVRLTGNTLKARIVRQIPGANAGLTQLYIFSAR